MDDSSEGVGATSNGIRMEVPAEQAVRPASEPGTQSEMVQSALDPLPAPTTEGTSRREPAQVEQSLRQLSLAEPSKEFRGEVGNPPSNATVEEDQSKVTILAPQRSKSNSSTESDDELREDLRGAKSEAEKKRIYKDKCKDLRGQNKQLEDKNKGLENEKKVLLEQLQLVEDECEKLSILLDDAKTEGQKNDRSLKSQVENLEKKASVLQKALSYARRGVPIPGDIHLQLVVLGCIQGMNKLVLY